ncbi:MAG: 1-acyl-sn-glycerol-3-phosphate acyltransferase [Firmicutes bacterium]|nr:1-acyl-sn-glycerol-3-phosphate acyltransferase [Bacillota bacterium]
MILFLQVLLSVLFTILFLIFGTYELNFTGILTIIGVFLLAMIAFIILLFLFFVTVLFFFTKTDPKNLFKHQLFNTIGFYIFNVLLRVKIVVSGKENLPSNNHFVVVSNHIEYTDPIYVKQVFNDYPISYVSKESLFKVPIVRRLLKSSGCIPIYRGDNRQAMQSILLAIQSVKNGQPMGIFPEGTRSYKNEIAPFKAGSLKLATKAKADICPICLYNMHGIFKKGRIKIHKGYCHILPRIPFEEYENLDTLEITKRIELLISNQLTEFKKMHPED